MRKILVLATVFVTSCVLLMGCGSKDEKTKKQEQKAKEETTVAKTGAAALVGDWEYESGGFIYHFKDDGTGVYDAGGTEMPFQYTATDTVLSITYDGDTESMDLEYEIDGDTLNVKDSFGSDTIYKKK